MQITLTFPDAAATRILDAVAGAYRYDPTSGITKAQFARQVAAKFFTDTVINWEKSQRVTAIQAQLDATTFADPGIS